MPKKLETRLTLTARFRRQIERSADARDDEHVTVSIDARRQVPRRRILRVQAMSPKMALPFELTELMCATIVVYTPTGLNGSVVAVDAIPAELPVESVTVRLCRFSPTSPG
jgi:hypothetical protein